MALKGKLTLNDADYAPFELNGVGVFMAFSRKRNIQKSRWLQGCAG